MPVGNREQDRLRQQCAEELHLLLVARGTKLGGKELAQEIHRVRGDVPVILCTGFSEIPSEPELKALQICGLIMKPILMRELAEKIRLALGRGPA